MRKLIKVNLAINFNTLISYLFFTIYFTHIYLSIEFKHIHTTQQPMDWFSWLSKTGLDSSLVYEYGLAFSHNELEEDDVAYFNHEFLQSMGISIAKHRLEILKLARKERGSSHPMSRLILVIKRTKRCLAKYIRTWIRHEDSALVVVPRRGSRWKGGLLKKNKRLLMAKQDNNRLLLTNGSPVVIAGPRIDSFSSPMIHDLHDDEKMDGHDDGYWSKGVEHIRWDTMFQDLKPT